MRLPAALAFVIVGTVACGGDDSSQPTADAQVRADASPGDAQTVCLEHCIPQDDAGPATQCPVCPDQNGDCGPHCTLEPLS